MADDATGQWGTITFTVPDQLATVRDAINNFAELLISYLEIANVALEFVKAFIRSFLDPLVTLIELIIDEIVAILRDLRQIGLYITGDWALLGWPPEDLRGGFSAFERRMIARLSDRTDPTRPDVSSKTKVVGFFGYVSVDPSDIERLINFIITIIKMFGLSFFPDTSRMPIPLIQNVLYGPDAVGIGPEFNFSSLGDALGSFDGSPPQNARVTWIARPASNKHPLNPFPVLGPSGYLVTVSTLQEGIKLRYARPRANTDKKPADGDADKLVQPREYGSVLDMNGQPITLHGGAEMLSFKGSPFEYNKGISSTTAAPKDGVCQVFGMLDPASNEIIPLEDLGEASVLGEPGDGKGDQFYLQRTFLMKSGVALAQWFAGEYSMVLNIDDMPRAARWERQSDNTMKLIDDGPAANYYVRVWSVGKEIAEGTKVPQWDLKSSEIGTNAAKSGQPFYINLRSGDGPVSSPSAPRKMTLVGANTAEYLKAVETALLLLVLSRADLPLLEEITGPKPEEVAQGFRDGKWAGEQFALLDTGLEDSRALLRQMFPNLDVLAKPGQSPQKWRAALATKIRQMALDIYEQTGPMPGPEAAVVQATGNLRTVTWPQLIAAEPVGDDGGQAYKEAANKLGDGYGDKALIESLDSKLPVAGMAEFGICPNIMSMGIAAKEADELFYVTPDLPAGRAFRLREDEFAMWDGGRLEFTFVEEDPKKVKTLTSGASGALRRIYEQFTDSEGKLLIPQEWQVYLTAMAASKRVTSSGDMTPVFCLGASQLVRFTKTTVFAAEWPGVLNMRGLIRAYEDGVLYQEAAIALRIATAAFSRSPQDGEWIAIRLFDAFPELEEFLSALENWVKSLASAVQSMADAIVKYIEFVQAQIVELQQLIRRINSMIQSFLSFSFALPQFSGLMLLSDGTDGLMSDMVTAENKPFDSPRSYGGGVAVVVPLAPGFIFDLIALAAGEEPDPTATTAIEGAPDAIGTEDVPPEPGPPPTDEPDVL